MEKATIPHMTSTNGGSQRILGGSTTPRTIRLNQPSNPMRHSRVNRFMNVQPTPDFNPVAVVFNSGGRDTRLGATYFRSNGLTRKPIEFAHRPTQT
jgi:hypothetical protein